MYDKAMEMYAKYGCTIKTWRWMQSMDVQLRRGDGCKVWMYDKDMEMYAKYGCTKKTLEMDAKHGCTIKTWRWMQKMDER